MDTISCGADLRQDAIVERGSSFYQDDASLSDEGVR
jgi:hypothetical protein